MKLKDDRFDALSRWFGELKGDQVFVSLEDRAHDSGHLEDADYERLIDGAQDARNVNLRRHVMFCETCSEEFLRRAGPGAEGEFLVVERKAERRRWIIFGLAAVATLVTGVWVAVLVGTAEPEAAEFRARVNGVLFTPEGRLQVRVDAADGRPLHIYVFEVNQQRARALHPDPVEGHRNPVSPGLLPSAGWTLEEGVKKGVLLVVLSEREEAFFADGPKRRAFEAMLDQRCREGWGSDGLAALAQERVASRTAKIQIVPFRR